jgi:uncharacterized protein involved in exopolysaccharide biosynthesis
VTSPESSGLRPRGHGQPDDEARASDEIGLLELVTVLLKHWRATIVFPLALGFVTGLVSLVLPLTYTATTTFVPEKSAQGRLPPGLAGIATQFGIPSGTDASQSPRFYAQVVRSRELMEHVLLIRYLDPRQKEVAHDSATLLVILGVRGRDSADSLQRGMRKLNRLVSVRVDDQTNIVSLMVDAHYPALAAAVANKFVEYLNAFNAQYRQSQAREQRKFVEQRLADGERELRSAEEDLRTFYERNRSWQQSPQLAFEEGRIRRQLEIRQEVYLTLRREYETARIEEVNDIPIITVVDAAVAPVEKSSPKRALLVVIALVLGGTVGALWAASAEYLKHVRNERKELYEDFSNLLRSVRGEIRRALRTLIPGKT